MVVQDGCFDKATTWMEKARKCPFIIYSGDRDSVWCLPAWINILSGEFTFCGCAYPPRLCGATPDVFSDVCQHGKSLYTQVPGVSWKYWKHYRNKSGRAFISGTRLLLIDVDSRCSTPVSQNHIIETNRSMYISVYINKNLVIDIFIHLTHNISAQHSFSKFLFVLFEATKGKQRDVFSSDRTYNFPFIHWSAWKRRIHRTIDRGILSRSELLFPELLFPEKALRFRVCPLFPASRSRRLETLWGIARNDLDVHWVNTECFGPAVFIYEISSRASLSANSYSSTSLCRCKIDILKISIY